MENKAKLILPDGRWLSVGDKVNGQIVKSFDDISVYCIGGVKMFSIANIETIQHRHEWVNPAGKKEVAGTVMRFARLTDMFKKWFKHSKKAQCAIVGESAFTEVYLKNHGWQKLLSQGEYGNHEGLEGVYYLVNGFGKVHETYCKYFR